MKWRLGMTGVMRNRQRQGFETQDTTSAISKFLSLLEPALQRSRAWKSESVCSLYFVVLHIQFSRKKYLTLEATFGGHL